MDTVKSATHTHFPVDMLDALSIEDVLDLHRIAVEERFVDKYNTIQEKIREGLTVHDPERLVLLMEELDAFERQLHAEFGQAIQDELPRALRQQKEAQGLTCLNAVASVVLAPWGLVAGASEIVVSGLEFAGRGRLAAEIQDRVRRGLEGCLAALHAGSLDGKPVLLDFVRRMQLRYAEKMHGAW